MQVQFKELRTRVVREVCKTIEMLAETFFASFAGVAGMLLPTLITLTMNKVAILNEAADHCLKAILKNSPSSSLGKQIYSNVKDSKSTTIRAKCAEYIVLMLQLWPKGELKGAELEKTLMNCLQDADSTARGEARKAMCKFSTYWPNRTRRILNTCDKAVLKTLQQEQPSVFSVMQRGPVNKLKPQLSKATQQADDASDEGDKKQGIERKRAEIMHSPAFKATPPAPPANSAAYPTIGKKIGSLSFDTPSQASGDGAAQETPDVNSLNASISKLLDGALFASHDDSNSPLSLVQPNHLHFQSPASVAIRNARRKIAQTRSSIRIMSSSPCSPFNDEIPPSQCDEAAQQEVPSEAPGKMSLLQETVRRQRLEYEQKAKQAKEDAEAVAAENTKAAAEDKERVGQAFMSAISAAAGAAKAAGKAIVTAASAIAAAEQLAEAQAEAAAAAAKVAEQLADEEAKLEAEAAAAETAMKQAEEEAKLEAEAAAAEMTRLEAEAVAMKLAEETARLEAVAAAAELAQRQAEEDARIVAAQKAKEAARLEAEEKARVEAEEVARLEAEEKAHAEAAEVARLEAEEKARMEAEEVARLEAEEKARVEAEEVARLEAEEKACIEAEDHARCVSESAAAAELVMQQAEAEARIKAEAEAAARVQLTLKQAEADRKSNITMIMKVLVLFVAACAAVVVSSWRVDRAIATRKSLVLVEESVSQSIFHADQGFSPVEQIGTEREFQSWASDWLATNAVHHQAVHLHHERMQRATKEFVEHEFQNWTSDWLAASAIEHEAIIQEQTRIEAEEHARMEAQKRARIEAEAEEQARIEAEKQARAEAVEHARMEAQEQARIQAAAEEQAKMKAQEQARFQAEEQARLKTEEQARLEQVKQMQVHQQQAKIATKELINHEFQTWASNWLAACPSPATVASTVASSDQPWGVVVVGVLGSLAMLSSVSKTKSGDGEFEEDVEQGDGDFEEEEEDFDEEEDVADEEDVAEEQADCADEPEAELEEASSTMAESGSPLASVASALQQSIAKVQQSVTKVTRSVTKAQQSVTKVQKSITRVTRRSRRLSMTPTMTQ
jgi:hypothetical protein